MSKKEYELSIMSRKEFERLHYGQWNSEGAFSFSRYKNARSRADKDLLAEAAFEHIEKLEAKITGRGAAAKPETSASEKREIFEAGAKWWFCEVNPGKDAGYWFTRQSKAEAARRYPDTPEQPPRLPVLQNDILVEIGEYITVDKDGVVGGIEEAANAVVALFGRCVAQPPRPTITEDDVIEQIESYIDAPVPQILDAAKAIMALLAGDAAQRGGENG